MSQLVWFCIDVTCLNVEASFLLFSHQSLPGAVSADSRMDILRSTLMDSATSAMSAIASSANTVVHQAAKAAATVKTRMLIADPIPVKEEKDLEEENLEDGSDNAEPEENVSPADSESETESVVAAKLHAAEMEMALKNVTKHGARTQPAPIDVSSNRVKHGTKIKPKIKLSLAVAPVVVTPVKRAVKVVALPPEPESEDAEYVCY